ncbi:MULTISPECIES: O-methyltransferase [Nocardia]|uniref:O-methyltransferase n=1 Tax=Nocardia TaxID=1817 RepID=UPI001895FDAA|nr:MULTISPECIES: class I SAM-dependent methyltransferase [Nocardia]MBF6352168.1 class I SAM-dependent methyltransferase [Nocardia flavorosea]
MISSPLQNPALDRLVAELQERSTAQVAGIGTYFADRADQGNRADLGKLDTAATAFLADKLVALEHDKALLCHQLCLALRARRIVEVGTSYGVSTLYLAQAVRLIAEAGGGTGVVIGTECEPGKIAAAQDNFRKAGLADYIDLREGDVRKTLVNLAAPVDLALIDIWPAVARPALELIAPKLRPGGIILIDNTENRPESYRATFEFIDDPANGLLTQTLPFRGGLELVVKR